MTKLQKIISHIILQTYIFFFWERLKAIRFIVIETQKEKSLPLYNEILLVRFVGLLIFYKSWKKKTPNRTNSLLLCSMGPETSSPSLLEQVASIISRPASFLVIVDR